MDAASALAWVREEVAPLAAELQPALPPADAPLCDFLRDGRALCLLSSALEPAAALPKNLQRSLHQTTTFHSLERVQFFIKWSRAALDAHLVISSVQLLDERNDAVVAACLAALRSKFRPHLPPLAAAAPAKPPSVRAAPPSDDNQAADEEAAATPTPSLPAASSKLSAFLNKVPSKPNVLVSAAPVAAAAAAAADVAAAAVEEADSSDDDDDDDNNSDKDNNPAADDDDENDDDEEEVEPYDEDEHVAVTAQPPRAALTDAFSPRSSIARSSLSFSFTSDPRGHESFSEDQHTIDLSFSSVMSSPPASPKPPPRVRIPSIFERTAEKPSASAPQVTSASAVSTAPPTSRDDATPRKLQIPSAFSASAPTSAAALPPTPPTPAVVVAAAPAPVEPVAAPAAEVESSPVAVEAEAAADVPLHKTVSKLSIPSAFTRSGSASSGKSDKSPFAKSESDAAVPASPSPPVLTKKPSRLKIPSVFAAGASAAAPPAASPSVKQVDVVMESAQEETASVAVETHVVAVEEAPAAPTEAPESNVPRSPFAAFVNKVPSATRSSLESAAAPAAEVAAPVAAPPVVLEEVVPVKIEEAPTTPKKSVESKVSAVPRSPFAAFVSSVPSISRSTSSSASATPAPAPAAEIVAPVADTLDEVVLVKVEEAPSTPKKKAEDAKVDAVPRSPFAAFVGAMSPPSFGRSTSNSATNPASKLAAFLSKVEPASPLALASPSEAVKEDVVEQSSVDDAVAVATAAAVATEAVAERLSSSSSDDGDGEQEEFHIERGSEQRDDDEVEGSEELTPADPPKEEAAALVETVAYAEARVLETSESTSKPAAASKLAAFLSKVEPATVFAPVVSNAQEPEDVDERTSESRALADAEDDDNASDSSESVDLDAETSDVAEKTRAAAAATSEDLASRASESQETAIGLPATDNEEDESDKDEVNPESDVESNSSDEDRDSKEQFDERLSEDSADDEHVAADQLTEVLTDDEPVVQRSLETEGDADERQSESSGDSAAAEEVAFEERISDASNDEVGAAAVDALATTTAQAEEEEEEDVEHHAIDHHDHTDSEQPFFVVEEVSLSKPAASSKLYAFLSAVDSAPVDSSQTHRFSHNSGQDEETGEHSEHAATRSVASSSLKSLKKAGEESTTSELSEQTPRNSVTAAASAAVVASSEVILEKERLSGENLALQLKLKAADDELAAKESAIAHLCAQLAALTAQLEASQAASDAKATAATEDFDARLAAATASHLEALASARSAAVRESKLAAEDQRQSFALSSQATESRVSALEARNAELEQQLQQAKDSEEAARYSAQVAFAARDEMEALVRPQEA